MLVRLLYASRATSSVSSEMISDILEQSRRNNEPSGITGALCLCHDDVFIQLLEGGREEVSALYGRVVRDSRHRDVTLLDYSEIPARTFGNWRMGRIDLNKVNAGLVLKYSEKARLDPFSISGSAALKLLEELMRTASMVGGN